MITMRICIIVFSLAWCRSSCSAAEPAASLAPRVLHGGDLLEKKRVLHDARIGDVTDLKFVEKPDGESLLIVAGTMGAALVKPDTYEIQRVISYHDEGMPYLQHDIVDVDSDGRWEFAREPHSAADAAVLNDEGVVLWSRSPPGSGFPKATFGDVDGDKNIDFLLWTSGRQQLLDGSGKVRWTQRWEGNTSEIRLVDFDNDGRDEIVSINGKALFIRDGEGKLVRRVAIKKAQYVNSLEPTQFPFDEDGSRIVVGYNYASGIDLKQTFRLVAADGSMGGEIAADDLPFYATETPVQLGTPAKAYRAGRHVLKYQGQPVGFSSTRLHFSLYDMKGHAVYEEIIGASSGESIPGDGDVEATPPGDAEQKILVGYGPEVWEYRTKKAD